MLALIICAALFIAFLIPLLCIAFSQTAHPSATSAPVIIASSFVLASLLGFILANDLLALKNPIALTVVLMLCGSIVLELIQLRWVPQKAALGDIVLVLIGVCLFVFARFFMHTVGMNIVDQFEVFLD